jgi:poly(hydroxyalkanoate) depolymerase family esterase
VSPKLAKSMQIALDLTRAGDLAGATRAIRKALLGSKEEAAEPSNRAGTIDLGHESWSEAAGAAKSHTGDSRGFGRNFRIARPLHEVIDALGRLKQRVLEPGVPPDGGRHRPLKIPPGARFETRSIGSGQGHRSFKLYIPARPLAEPRSLLIMLHGCTQTPEDFAAGTRMNQLAEQNGFVVAYPAQPKSANSSACWNWFNPQNQTRGAGEAQSIADLAQTLIAEFRIHPGRAYVAGLSAGGAMAAIMAATYPDVFSAVGIHSGLPYRSASDVVSALAAMRGQVSPSTRQSGNRPSVPAIVFHGSADHIVHPSNGAKIIAAHAGSREIRDGKRPEGNGRSFRRMITRDDNGLVRAEYWIIEGGGHAWSGGSTDGSFSDPLGPDASREMVRFFFEREASRLASP